MVLNTIKQTNLFAIRQDSLLTFMSVQTKVSTPVFEFSVYSFLLAEFGICGKEQGLMMPFRCRKEAESLRMCLTNS
jgi:hypothetical protein